MSKAKSTTRRKFTRVPKASELVGDGVPLHTIPTYLALSDHADNRTGRTHVSVNEVARILKVCRRTVERHLSALERAGVIKRQHQRRVRGRFSSCLCVVISFALFAVRHQGKDGSRRANKRTIPLRTNREESKEESKERAAARRREGYGWLFDR